MYIKGVGIVKDLKTRITIHGSQYDYIAIRCTLRYIEIFHVKNKKTELYYTDNSADKLSQNYVIKNFLLFSLLILVHCP